MDLDKTLFLGAFSLEKFNMKLKECLKFIPEG
jgi:hypothetical protein